MRTSKQQRVGNVIIKGIFGLTLLGMTVYLAWYEFGTDIFNQPVFMFLIAMWIMYGCLMFFDRMDRAIEKDTDEKVDNITAKLDELIQEIRQDRNERNNKSE